MGEFPDHIMLTCAGCQAQFRLKPKRGKLPEGPIPCPRCGHQIPIEVETSEADDTSHSGAHTGQMAPSEVEAAARLTQDPTISETSSSETSSSEVSAESAAQPTSGPIARKRAPWETAKLPGSPPLKSRRATATGGPRSTHRLSGLDEDLEEDEFDHIQIAPGLHENNPKSTFLGMGASLAAINGPGHQLADRTKVVEPDAVERLKAADQLTRETSESAAITPEQQNQQDAQARKTAEQEAVGRQKLDASAAQQAKTDSSDNPKGESDATSELPTQMILGRIKLKQKLRKSLEKSEPVFDRKKLVTSASSNDGEARIESEADQPSAPSDATLEATIDPHKVDTKPTYPKPTLSSLLKKARARNVELPSPPQKVGDSDSDAQWEAVDALPNPQDVSSARQRSAEALDRALSALADETARALNEKDPPPLPERKPTPEQTQRAKKPLKSKLGDVFAAKKSSDKERTSASGQPLPYETGESSMIELLRRRVAENQQPGAASERRGSGYIRLPTAEIQDVLGLGTYRLRVEDIIYEPIDKTGLTELVKRGVLMGAAEIAESDGDWMPVSEHPMLAELRQRMAAEAHELLNEIGKKSGITASKISGPPSRPPETVDAAGPTSPYPTTLSGIAAVKGPMDTFDQDFADLKDSAEIATLPALEARARSLKADAAEAEESASSDDFFTANSGLFADMDAEREASREVPLDTVAPPHQPTAKTAPSAHLTTPGTVKSPAKADPATPEPAETVQSQDGAAQVVTPETSATSSSAPTAPTAKARPETRAPEDAAPIQRDAPETDGEVAEDAAHGDLPEDTADITADPLLDDPLADDPLLEPERKSRGLLWALLLLVAGGIALAFSPIGRPYVDDLLGDKLAGLTQRMSSDTARESKTTPSAKPQPANKPAAATPEVETSPEELAARTEAIDQASSQINEALQVDLEDSQLHASVAASLAEAGEHQKAVRVLNLLWPEQKNSPDFVANFASQLIRAGEFGRAVDVSIHGVNLSESGQTGAKKHDFAALYEEAIDKNPELGAYHTIDLKPGEQADEARAVLRGQRPQRVVLELSLGGEASFDFNPSQAKWERDWRASIAAWRLCEVIVCHFAIPRTRPARIDRATFEKLMASGQSAAQKDGQNAASEGVLESLNWVTENGEEYLYGALVDTTRNAARFPIESTSLWRNWLSAESSDDLSQPALKAIAGLKKSHPNLYEPIARQIGDMTLGDVASQLSTMLLFDYLTNNWDRFRPAPEDWGAHVGVIQGRLVSTLNLTTFQSRSSTRVKGRFDWSSRFSRDTITSLKMMSPETVGPLLFPKASAGEKAAINVFWEQRTQAIKRVDDLVAMRGAKLILPFD